MGETGARERGSWPFWRRYLNLAQPRLGAEIVSVTDDFFGAADRMIQPGEPIFVPGRYDEHGKWMDGWESRRRRDGGHDECIVRLGWPATVHGVDIDTRFFDGNQPLAAAIGRRRAGSSRPTGSSFARTELGRTRSIGSRSLRTQRAGSVRLRIFPDGGVARLRVFGAARRDWSALGGAVVDLVAAENGGSVIAASDEHFGAAAKLLLPGRGLDMGDGWETRRRRGPGFDWVVVALGHPGAIERVVLDTRTSRATSRTARCRRVVGALRAISSRPGGRSSCRAAPARRRRAPSRAARPVGAGLARAAEHLPGRRREPIAPVRRPATARERRFPLVLEPWSRKRSRLTAR
jgi:allantoicase